jgi:hypothetical protein
MARPVGWMGIPPNRGILGGTLVRGEFLFLDLVFVIVFAKEHN